jgi:ATP-dependent protease HslVU (ClpYQ) peptidase subunit
MSVIAVYITDQKIVLGGDTQITYGHHKIIDGYYGKIFDVNGVYIGGVGSCFEVQFFRRFLEEKRLREGFTEKDFNDLMLDFYTYFRHHTKDEGNGIQCNYILIHDRKAFLFQHWLIKEVEEFEAIGSGGETARTVYEVFKQLQQEPDMEKILSVSCKIDLYCHEPLKIFEIDKTANSEESM